MKSARILFLFALVLIAVLVTSVPIASASAGVDIKYETCSGFTAGGGTTAPYVYIFAQVGANRYFTVVRSSGGRYYGAVSFPAQPVGTYIDYEVWGGPANVAVGAPGYWDGESFYDSFVPCANGAVGPPKPNGYELHTITCDVPVASEPAGSQVDDDHITAGQTWFVSPTPETAPDGSSWTAIWTGGYLVGYIPTSCVGGFVTVP